MSGIVLYLSLCVWLISLGITSFRFVHVITDVRMSFLVKAEPALLSCVYQEKGEGSSSYQIGTSGLSALGSSSGMQLVCVKNTELIDSWVSGSPF